MKPPPFQYHAPADLDEALEVLAAVGEDGKVLAGGQSLIPILNFRLAAPAHLVDINRVPGLGTVLVEAGGVRVGATVRHAELERDARAHARLPLLREALRLVAHPVVRNRGTPVGSLVHADPAGELTAVLALLGGTVELARRGSRRTVGADDFFLAPLESCVEPGELAVAAFFPAPPPGTGTSVVEVARRHGDYALCGVVAAVGLDGDGRVAQARAAFLGVAPVPLVLDLTEAVSEGAFGEPDLAAAGRLAAARVEPEADLHASAEYRRHLADVLTVRALGVAVSRAGADPTGPEVRA